MSCYKSLIGDKTEVQSRIPKNQEHEFVFKKRYPDFGFICPSCGSLDLLVNFGSTLPKCHCLECNYDWCEMTNSRFDKEEMKIGSL